MESVAFFMFQIDLLRSTGTEHIMYLAFVKYKQYLMQGIEHYVGAPNDIHTLISQNLVFFNTFLDMKTKNQSLIDIMKTLAADTNFQ